MESSKEGEMPGEPSPESLPIEEGEAKPKKTMMLAVIIVVVLIVAAIAAAFGLGLFGKKEEAQNLPPTAGARAITDTSVDVGGTVTFESTSSDPDGYIVNQTWNWGDGTQTTGNLSSTTHQYLYGGSYLVLLVVEDNEGKTASNVASMVGITVLLYVPSTESADWTNTTAPFAILAPNNPIPENNTAVVFNMTGSWGIAYNSATDEFDGSWENITSMTLDYGDGSAVATVTPAAVMTATHTYVTPGHYAAKLNVTGGNGVSTIVMNTVHVLAPDTTSSGTIKNPDAFVEVTIGEPQYLDPSTDYETAGGEVIMNAYETLVWYQGASASILVPLLATEVPSLTNSGISADGLNYTFHLKPNVKFHDNTTMTADDVVYSIVRVLRMHDPDGPSWMLEQVMNDYIQYSVGDELQNFSSTPWIMAAIGGTAPTYKITELDVQNASEAAVVKVDASTVTMRLTHSYPGFLYIMAYTVGSVVSKTFVEAHGGIVNAEHNGYMDEHTCGTGPYSLVSWEKGSRIHMTRFASYHGTLPALKDAYVIKANDVNTRILMLQAGDADTGYIPIDYESIFAGDSKFEITKGLPTFNIDFVGFNLNINTTAASAFGSTIPANFFADKNIRKAFCHLFDATTFIANYEKGNAIVPNGVIPAGMFGYNASMPAYDYNVTKAKEYLENATNTATGHSWWVDGFTVAYIFNAGNLARETASQYLKQALESLNSFPGTHGTFHATINSLDWPTYLTQTQLKPMPLPVWFLGWAPDYADPDDYVNPFLYSHGTYPTRSGYANASIDENVTLAASELNAVARQALYDNITALAYDDAPYILEMQVNNFHVERSWLTGYYFNPMYPGFYFAQYDKA
jgi:peptide/nickel transport system substrate-binding protein